MKILAIDVHYEGNDGFAAGVMFQSWSVAEPLKIYKHKSSAIAPYVPGEFYKRELPCIVNLLNVHHLAPDLIIVDGHVFLDGVQKRGLGAYLYDALDQTIPILGVGKSRFKDMCESYGLLRGQSQNKLYITSVGMAAVDAKDYIAKMHGAYRIPTLLKLADTACRNFAIESHSE